MPLPALSYWWKGNTFLKTSSYFTNPIKNVFLTKMRYPVKIEIILPLKLTFLTTLNLEYACWLVVVCCCVWECCCCDDHDGSSPDPRHVGQPQV